MTARLAPGFANAYPIAIAIACMGTAELACDVDEDGVYRGESWVPPESKELPETGMEDCTRQISRLVTD